MVGGLYYDNYPAGTGLVAGAVFGRIAGRHAALRTPPQPRSSHVGAPATTPTPAIANATSTAGEGWVP
jgi:hypothetical protein